MFYLVHQGVKPQLNPPGFIPLPLLVVKPKEVTKAKPCLSQMSKELHQYAAGVGFSTLDYNLSEMGKLSNSRKKCVPINGGFLHASSQLVVIVSTEMEVYDDVGDIANIVAGGWGVR